MPSICPHCGTQNPDDNVFCQSCGQDLPTAPTRPLGPAPQLHRTPWLVIVGAVVGTIALLTVGVVVLGQKGGQRPPGAQPLATPSPVPAPAGVTDTPAPTATEAS